MGSQLIRFINLLRRNLTMKVNWAKFGNGYEVSSKGDTRFSAFNTMLFDGRSIEMHYQCDIKGYDKGGVKWWLGKGKPPLIANVDLWNEYLLLWKDWAFNNSILMDDLKYEVSKKNYLLTDMFSTTPVNQARALATILNNQ